MFKNKKRMPASHLFFLTILEVLTRTIRQQKEIKGIQIGKVKVKLPMFTDNTILHAENSKDSTTNH